jgi:hypothetical protein
MVLEKGKLKIFGGLLKNLFIYICSMIGRNTMWTFLFSVLVAGLVYMHLMPADSPIEKELESEIKQETGQTVDLSPNDN